MFAIGITIGALVGIFIMCVLQINRKKKECLHCGRGAASYCEKCFQELISENERLRLARIRPVYNDLINNNNHIPRID